MDINDVISKHNVILITKFGSHLYGTDTPESDVDYKGIYIPTLEDIILNRVKDSFNYSSNKSSEKNSKDDIDFELYSIHKFFNLASKGETVSIDMLSTNNSNIVYKNKVWDEIQINRRMFYSKNLKSFLGYAQKQAAKYGLRGSRLDSANNLLRFLKSKLPEQRLSEFWCDIPTDEHTFLNIVNDGSDLRTLNFCGKIIQETVKVSYAIDIVEKFIDKYGHRAKLAQQNDGVDFKALSHAMRAALQVKEILTTNDLKYPLKDAKLLCDIKCGKLHFSEVNRMIESAIDEVKELTLTSKLRDNVNKEEIDNLLYVLLIGYYKMENYYEQ